MKMTDAQLSKFAAAVCRLIEDIEKTEDEPTEVTASGGSSAAEIQAAKQVENLRQKLTGYEAASAAAGASADLQNEILQIKAELRDRDQTPAIFEIPPSGWGLQSNNARMELACRRHEYDALAKFGNLQQQITCLDRIRQLESTIARG